MKSLFFPLMLLLGMAGCANPYQRHYSTVVEKAPKSEALALKPAQGPPRLVTTTHMGRDAIKLLEEGYLPVGRSEFKSNSMYPGSALVQAEQVGASVVVIKEKHLGSVTQSVPMSQWIPDRRITTTESSRTFEPGREEALTSYRESTTVIEGEYETRYEPETRDYFEYVATFWKEAHPPRFGVLVSELDEDLRRRLESNKGVEVKAVVRNSPAFEADLLRGDVLRRFAGRDVLGSESLFEMIASHAGKEVTVEVWRDGRALSRRVTLRP